MSAPINAYLQWYLSGQSEPPPPPPPPAEEGDTWWTMTDNSVQSESEVTPPDLAGYNLWFSKEDFAEIQSSWGNAAYSTIKTRLESSTHPVPKAIVGNIVGGTTAQTKCTEAYNAIITTVSGFPSTHYVDNTKNAFTALWAACFVHDWCKGFMSNTKKAELWSAVKSKYGLTLSGASIYADKHQRKLASHEATFYQILPTMAVAFCDQDAELWPALMRDMFSSSGGRALNNYFLRSGRSAQGNYSAVKIGGFIGMEAAFAKLIPAGKTMFSPYVKHLCYKLFEDMRNNRHVWNDGEINDNHIYDKSYPSEKLVYLAHAALYADGTMKKAVEELDNFRQYTYDANVINYIFDAVTILKNIQSSADYSAIPLVGKSHYPLSRVTYKTAHIFNESNTQNYYATDFKIDEVFTGNHDANDHGSVQFAGLGGWLLIGDTGAFSGTFSKHGWNWFRGGYGRAMLLTKDFRDNWHVVGTSSDRVNTGGTRFPLNGNWEPENVAEVESAARGSFMTEVRAYATNNEFTPDYVYAKADLSKAYRGDNKVFYDRLEWYTRQKIDFKTDVVGTGIQGMSFVIDKFKHLNPSNGYIFNWPCTANPVISGRRAEVTFDSSSTTKPRGWLYCAYPEEATFRFASGWESMAPSNDKTIAERSEGQRIETHPYIFTTNNRYVHVFEAGDSTMAGAPDTDCKNLIGTGFQVCIKRGKGVLFNTEDLLFQAGFSFTMPETADMVFTDFQAGNWTINNSPFTVESSKQCMYYPALTGVVTIAKV